MTKDTKISELTVGELIAVIKAAVKEENDAARGASGAVSGIDGIAEIFGVSRTTAKRIKASGVINDAISQSGKVIVTDVEKAKALYRKATHGRKTI